MDNTEQINQLYNKHRQHFVAYSILFFLYGATVNSLGPLFPYLSQLQHTTQTTYSLLFVFRAAGYLIGCTLSKIWEHKFNYHTYLKIGCLMLSFSSFIFTVLPSSMQFKCILMLICGWGCAICNMFLHSAIIWMYRYGKLDWYLIVAHGVYGIGGLFGPLLVMGCGINSYRVLFVGLLIAFGAFMIIKSPQCEQNIEIRVGNGGAGQLEKGVKKMQLNWLTGILMCPILMLVVGQQTIYGGWISSYAVMQSFAQKEHATIFSSVFWISITFFRFILASTPGPSSFKLLILFSLSFLSSLLSLLFIHSINPSFGLYASALLFGLANSIIYALGLSLPQDFNLMLSRTQSSNFILSSSFGGILAVLAGQMMNLFGADALFWMLGLMGVLGFFNVMCVVSRMKEQTRNEKMVQIQQNGLENQSFQTTTQGAGSEQKMAYQK